MTYTIPTEDRGQMTAAYDLSVGSDNWYYFYSEVYKAITDRLLLPVGGGVVTFEFPVEGLDTAVWLWIRGAINVNSGSGVFGNYIRDYTIKQYQYRSGDSLSPADVEAASDAIAQRFGADLVLGTVGNAQWQMPTLDRIGIHDAGAAAAQVFKNSASSTGQSNPSPWAGTVLFAGLGDPSYFAEWVLSLDGDVPPITVGGETRYGKQESGAYDLFAAAQATLETKTAMAAIETLLSPSEVQTLGWVTSIGGAATASAWAAADGFMANTYGQLAAEQYQAGRAIFDNLYGAGTDFGFRVGTVGTDQGNKAVRGTTYNEAIHAGAGHDEILASVGSDLVDGGDGNDLLTYDQELTNLSLRLRVSFDDEGHWGWRAKIDKIPGAGGPTRQDLAYNIEELTLSRNSDTVLGGSGVTVPGAGLVIDAGDGRDFILGTTHGVTVSGGEGNDFIRGTPSDERTHNLGGLLMGGDDADYLMGYAGDTLNGGAGNDYLVAKEDGGITYVFQAGSGHDVWASSPFFEGTYRDRKFDTIRLLGLRARLESHVQRPRRRSRSMMEAA